jgi:hypothetical protein
MRACGEGTAPKPVEFPSADHASELAIIEAGSEQLSAQHHRPQAEWDQIVHAPMQAHSGGTTGQRRPGLWMAASCTDSEP